MNELVIRKSANKIVIFFICKKDFKAFILFSQKNVKNMCAYFWSSSSLPVTHVSFSSMRRLINPQAVIGDELINNIGCASNIFLLSLCFVYKFIVVFKCRWFHIYKNIYSWTYTCKCDHMWISSFRMIIIIIPTNIYC